MPGKAKPIPEDYSSITPCLTIRGADKAIDFYKKVFGATEVMRMAMPDGTVGHAELKIGDSKIMLGEECPESFAAKANYLYVEDVDKVVNAAVAAGAKITKPVQDQFYGDRSGAITDPFGHVWWVATHVEDVAEDEIRRRSEAWMKEQAGKKSAA